MNDAAYSYSFELEKLEVNIYMLSCLAYYLLDEVEVDAIRILLKETNTFKGKYLDWTLDGKQRKILIQLAHVYDEDYNWGLVAIRVYNVSDILTEIKMFEEFQGMFKNFEIDYSGFNFNLDRNY